VSTSLAQYCSLTLTQSDGLSSLFWIATDIYTHTDTHTHTHTHTYADARAYLVATAVYPILFKGLDTEEHSETKVKIVRNGMSVCVRFPKALRVCVGHLLIHTHNSDIALIAGCELLNGLSFAAHAETQRICIPAHTHTHTHTHSRSHAHLRSNPGTEAKGRQKNMSTSEIVRNNASKSESAIACTCDADILYAWQLALGLACHVFIRQLRYFELDHLLLHTHTEKEKKISHTHAHSHTRTHTHVNESLLKMYGNDISVSAVNALKNVYRNTTFLRYRYEIRCTYAEKQTCTCMHTHTQEIQTHAHTRTERNNKSKKKRENEKTRERAHPSMCASCVCLQRFLYSTEQFCVICSADKKEYTHLKQQCVMVYGIGMWCLCVCVCWLVV